jgi:hypothetical protein
VKCGSEVHRQFPVVTRVESTQPECMYISYEPTLEVDKASFNSQPYELSSAMSCASLSPWHGAFSGCECRRRPPDMEGTYEYIQ